MNDEHVHDPEADIDPQDALGLDYDESTDVGDSEGPDYPDIDGEPEHIEGAVPVCDECADEDIPVDLGADDDVDEDEEEEDE